MKKLIGIVLALTLMHSATYAEDIQLITNRDKLNFNVSTPLVQKPWAQPVYDLSFVAYDNAFAKEFGLRQDFVTEMDKGLRWMEIRMVTEGQQTNCYYNLIIDKSIEVDFPDENYEKDLLNPRLNFTYDYHGPNRVQPGTAKKLRIKRTVADANRFSNRTQTASCWKNTEGNYDCSSGTANLLYYIQDREASYRIFSLSNSCYLMSDLTRKGRIEVWVAKAHNVNYNVILNPSGDLFNRFAIPDSLIAAAKPWLKQFHDIRKSELDKLPK